MKVYIVTREECGFEGYSNDAVFLSREEAEKYIDVHKYDDIYSHLDIEEHETQEVCNPVGYVYSGYYDSENHFCVDKTYHVGFKGDKLGVLQVWLSRPDYKRAEQILVNRYYTYRSHGKII